MKPFNLEEAKAGKPICTRNGDKARIIYYGLKGNCPIVAAVQSLIQSSTGEFTIDCRLDGRLHEIFDSPYDLFMQDEKPKCPFKPFDKVLVRDGDHDFWTCDIFSHLIEEDEYLGIPLYVGVGLIKHIQCIPYNEETEHLIGTNEIPPEKYVIW